ncbi:MAG TPA: protein kinase [Kofleriaceae bacterium]|nr:protein kinase [Kofleriaceae bacterium]
MIAPGLRIGHYLIEKRIGAGGMGEVFRAFDEKLERPVAMKVLPQMLERNEDARARMLREARAASAIVHPGIVTVHEVDEHEGRIFLVMEYVEGETFSQLLAKRGRLQPGEALKLVRPVASALEFAHKQGFVHRDIKCSNLMVTTNGHVKVLDFGLSKRVRRDGAAVAPPPPAPDTVGMRKGVAARLAAAGGEAAPAAPADAATRPGTGILAGRPPSMPRHDVDVTGPTQSVQRPAPANDDLTVEGSAMGTPGYSALELMDGLEADARADIYSLGIVLYELLTATRPFSGATFATVREDVARERYRRARELVPDISSELDDVINEALRADREQRTPSATALLAGLAEASAAPRKRRRALSAIAGAAVVAGGGWGILHLSRTGARAAAPSDALVALPGPGDGGVADGDALTGGDGGLATGPLAPVRITQLGGCADAPAFLDDDTVAFELTLPGGTPDIHVLSLGGGSTRQITNSVTWESAPAPGAKPGEVVYLVKDPANAARSSLVAQVLGGPSPREITAGAMVATATVGDDYYFVRENATELRRVHGGIDQGVARAAGVIPLALAASRDQRWIAMTGATQSTPADICLVDVGRRGTPRCLDLPNALPTRAAFGTTGALYYAAADGIHARLPPDGSVSADRIAAPDVHAFGGVAVSPDGRALVYSACTPTASLRDVGTTPQVELTSGNAIAEPVAGPGGRVAWVEGGREIVVRLPDGVIVRVAAAAAGENVTIARPAFDADGDTIAFSRTGDDPGIATVTLEPGATPTRLTSQPGDDVPLFLADGSILFTRMNGAIPNVFRIAPGADPAPVRPGRRALDVDRKTGRVLLLTPGAADLAWWSPETKTETPGPPATMPGFDIVRDISISPNGEWILYQAGADGTQLFRSALDAWSPVQVPAASPGSTVGLSAITDDGHALVVEVSKQGELWRLDAGSDPW